MRRQLAARRAVPLHAPPGDVTLLLELVDGGSLDAVVARRGAFPEATLAEVAAQALAGLAHLHARSVVHRDVKPANLLVSAAGEVKIANVLQLPPPLVARR